MSQDDLDRLFALYCDYTAKLNLLASRKLAVMSQSRFLAVWRAQDDAGREAWRRRFEAGFEKTAEEGRDKLIAAFSSTISAQACARAA